MENSTPTRSNARHIDPNFTGQQEAETPSNLNQHTSKRHQKNVVPPVRLDLGRGARNSNTATIAITSQLDAIEREAKIQRTIMYDFASTVDTFVSAYQHQEHRKAAHELCDKVVSFLSTSLFAETHNFAPIRLRSQNSDPSSSSAPKSVTFAGMAKTLRNSGADFHPAKAPHSSQSGRASTASSGGVSIGTGTTNQSTTSLTRQDKRVLVTVRKGSHTLLERPEPFALRRELCAKISGLTLAAIPTITPTRTGWAITASDLTTRDRLLAQENSEILLRTLDGTSVKQPEIWHNYAVPGVPITIHSLVGPVTNTAELITEEVIAQTKKRPVSCRPSRHGANPLTGKITWIVSFLEPVRPFRIFNASDLAKAIHKNPAIARHNPGCQGYCNPAKCTRYARCPHCSSRTDQHIGPSGENCAEAARCANCHGPHPAKHENCPAAPKRRGGKLIKLTKKELDAVRRHGDKQFRDAQKPTTDTASLTRDTQPRPQAQSREINAAPRNLLKRPGSGTQEHEDTILVINNQQGSTISPTTPANHTNSARPKRPQTGRKSLNIVDLTNEAHGSQEDMDLDTDDPFADIDTTGNPGTQC